MTTCMPVSISGNGAHVVIAGTANQVIQVFGLVLVANAATTFALKNGNSNFTGAMGFSFGGKLECPLGEMYFQTDAGEDFVVSISSLTGSVGGFILYNQIEI